MGILERIEAFKTAAKAKEDEEKRKKEEDRQKKVTTLKADFKALFEDIEDIEKEFTDDGFKVLYNPGVRTITIIENKVKIYTIMVNGNKWKPSKNMQLGIWGFDIFLKQFYNKRRKHGLSN